MSKYFYFVFAFFLILENFNLAFPSERCLKELIQICKYNMEVGNTKSLKGIKFAPLVRVNKTNDNEWGYVFMNEEERYKDDIYFLNSNSKSSAAYLEKIPKSVQFPPPINDKISYDREKRIIIFEGKMNDEDKNTLLNLSSDSSYRQAINKLYENSHKDTIWLYTSFEKDEHGNIPDFFWNLIVSPEPTVDQKVNAEGYIVNLTPPKYKGIGQEDWLTLLKSRIKDGDKTIFTNITIEDPDSSSGDISEIRRKINNLWVKLLSANNMDPIYCERNKQEKPILDYTFYFSKVSAEKENISLNYGYRVSNSKIVTTPGTVFGFAFNNKGECLGFCQMEIKGP